MSSKTELYEIDTVSLPRWYDVWGHVDAYHFVIESAQAEDDDGNVVALNPESDEWLALEQWMDANWPKVVNGDDPAEYWRKLAQHRRKHDLR